jgi:hypothetical protein
VQADHRQPVRGVNPNDSRIKIIAFNDAMILPYSANLGRIDFSEGTGSFSDVD